MLVLFRDIMAFEEGINLVWVLILALAIVAVMIMFYVHFRPQIEGGWLYALIKAIQWLLTPVV